MVVQLKKIYQEQIVPAMREQFKYKNTMQVPRVVKIVVNMGLGEAKENIKVIDAAAAQMGDITGQKPAVTRAKKSISNFKIRQGMPIGCKVTLRGDRMYEFLYRFINVTLPRIRDFRGINKKSFDKSGNYSIGIKDQTIFPEIEYEEIDKVRGMDITIVTTAHTEEESRALLSFMGMPFSK
ncbi:MAG: 50S ribosomal protein L5 [bacterium]